MRQMQGGKGGAMGFGKSKAKMMNEVITSTPELGKKRVSVLVKLDELAEFERKENPKRFSGKKSLGGAFHLQSFHQFTKISS